MANGKVVLMHDWLTGMRGGERVLEALCELFPQAPLYTLLHQPGSVSPLIEDRSIITSFLNNIPGIYNNYRKFLPLFPMAADSLKIKEDADLVLSTSHCVIKAVKKPKRAKHISYIHSPMRYIYDQFDVYFGPTAPKAQRVVAGAIRPYLTRYDLKSNENVDVLVANSKFVQKRIEKYYSRGSQVIHPFVDLKDFDFLKNQKGMPKKNYFVMVTAFAPNKRVDLAIEVFNKLKKPLKIIGSGQQEEMLKKISGPNIEFLGAVGREELIATLAQAQALIFPGVEDFGIVPLESMAAGTPVIALKQGGVLETLTTETAQFFDEPTVEKLEQAVQKFDSQKYSFENLRKQAELFTKEKFKKQISDLIQEQVGK